MIGEAIAAEAENWIGAPFKWQGCVRDGCDCKGLVAGVATACGRSEGNSLSAQANDYGPKVDTRRLLSGLSALFDRVGEIRPGDVLLVKVAGKAQHLAIAAPKDGQPSRAIQAWHTGPCKVLAGRLPRDMIHSIWRWRETDAA